MEGLWIVLRTSSGFFNDVISEIMLENGISHFCENHFTTILEKATKWLILLILCYVLIVDPVKVFDGIQMFF